MPLCAYQAVATSFSKGSEHETSCGPMAHVPCCHHTIGHVQSCVTHRLIVTLQIKDLTLEPTITKVPGLPNLHCTACVKGPYDNASCSVQAEVCATVHPKIVAMTDEASSMMLPQHTMQPL